MRKINEKLDTVGNNGMKKLYEAYETMHSGDFRNFCNEMVKNSRSSKHKKLSFIRELSRMSTKDKMVQFMTNMVLSGEGMSV